MSDPSRPDRTPGDERGEEAPPGGGVGWDGVPAGTSGSAAPGTAGAGDSRDRPSELAEADEDRKERAERASRETQGLGPRDDATVGGDLDGATGTAIGGATGAPPSVQDGGEAAGGTAPIGPNESARPGQEPATPDREQGRRDDR